MPAATLVRPDTDFIREVMASGGGDLKKCFQCATCSTICHLSPEDSPFPRKQMIEAQWGLKDRVLKDPAIWLCHNCGDCSTYCPRGARPGDVMGALRQAAIKSFAYPAFLGRMVADSRMWPVLFLLPALVFAAILMWAPAGEVTPQLEFANAFPIPVLEALFFAVAGLAMLGFVVSLRRFIAAIGPPGASGILAGLIPALTLIATHERFAKCTGNRTRYWGHLLTMWGFVGLGLVGTAVGIGTMVGLMRTPLDTFSAWKILANVCAVAVLVGLVTLFTDRITNSAARAASTYFDWFFLLTLTGVVVTGLVSQTLRLAQSEAMYPVYFVHLVLIFGLFLYAPYSKFAHLAYRTVAIASAKAMEKRPKPVDMALPESSGGMCRVCGTGPVSDTEQHTCCE